jgi:hypothetical protein
MLSSQASALTLDQADCTTPAHLLDLDFWNLQYHINRVQTSCRSPGGTGPCGCFQVLLLCLHLLPACTGISIAEQQPSTPCARGLLMLLGSFLQAPAGSMQRPAPAGSVANKMAVAWDMQKRSGHLLLQLGTLLRGSVLTAHVRSHNTAQLLLLASTAACMQ